MPLSERLSSVDETITAACRFSKPDGFLSRLAEWVFVAEYAAGLLDDVEEADAAEFVDV